MIKRLINYPEVEAAVKALDDARQEGRYAMADNIRAELTTLGVQLTSGPGGTDWYYF